MYDFLMAQIDGGGHPLSDLISRIDEAWALGEIGDGQKEDLLSRARMMAKPEDQWASNEDRIEALETALKYAISRIEVLESNSGDNEDSTASGDSIPEWKQPIGAFDAYDIGSLVSFGCKIWKSIIPANVWSPAVFPAGWEEV